MAKKRDRRVAPSSDGRKDRVESSHQLAGSASSSNRKLKITFVLFFIVSSAISILVYRLNYAPITDRTDSYVYRRGLVKPDVNYQEILTENAHVSENKTGRRYTYPVLAYITPWNSKGYELAKRFNSKFTHLSPIWYDLRSQGTSLILEGRHNADMGWISDLRMAGDAWVLPRVVLEAFPAELLTKKKQRSKAINLIVSECKEMGYDGIVLESWSRWAAYNILHDPKMRNLLKYRFCSLCHTICIIQLINQVKNDMFTCFKKLFFVSFCWIICTQKPFRLSQFQVYNIYLSSFIVSYRSTSTLTKCNMTVFL